jgi:hypothetical protein
MRVSDVSGSLDIRCRYLRKSVIRHTGVCSALVPAVGAILYQVLHAGTMSPGVYATLALLVLGMARLFDVCYRRVSYDSQLLSRLGAVRSYAELLEVDDDHTMRRLAEALSSEREPLRNRTAKAWATLISALTLGPAVGLVVASVAAISVRAAIPQFLAALALSAIAACASRILSAMSRLGRDIWISPQQFAVLTRYIGARLGPVRKAERRTRVANYFDRTEHEWGPPRGYYGDMERRKQGLAV